MLRLYSFLFAVQKDEHQFNVAWDLRKNAFFAIPQKADLHCVCTFQLDTKVKRSATIL
jgi:hypothetical protein